MKLKPLQVAIACLLGVSILTSCPPPVNPDSTVAVESVSLDKATLSLGIGETGQLSATVSPAGATDTRVTWSSSDEAVATVSDTGLVTAKAAGSATVTVKTTDGGKSAACSVTVLAPVAPSEDAFLSSLSLSVGGVARDLGFNRFTVSYSVTVPYGTTEVVVSAVPSNAGASIAGAGTVTLGAAGSPTDIPVVVTAVDGTTKKTYTIKVSVAAQGASSDASLSALSIGLLGVQKTLSPDFAPTTYSYTVVGGFPNGTSSATITATPADAGATVIGAGDRALAVGTNALKVLVTAADGVTTKTYTLNAERLNPESDRLSSLSLDGVGFSFSSDTRTYSLIAPNSLTSTSLAAAPEYAGSTVTLSTDGGTTFSAFSGSTQVSLEVGANTIVLRVKKQYTGTEGDYTLNVTRAEASASSDASLSALSLNLGGGSAITLSPAFESGKYSYAATVPSNTSSLVVTPSRTDSGAVAVVSGHSSLAYGSNTVTVTVTAADGTTKLTYSIAVTRRSPPGLTINSPVDGAVIDISGTPTLSLSGSFTDPNSEIASIGYFYSSNQSATISGDDFSATIDLTGSTNGEKLIAVKAQDTNGKTLATRTVSVTIAGGVTSHSISFYAVLPDGATQTNGYLSVIVNDASQNATYPVYDKDLSGVTFPLQISAEGLVDASYTIQVFITDVPIESATGYQYGGELQNVTVSGANVEAGNMNLLKP